MYKTTDLHRPEDIIPPTYEVRMKKRASEKTRDI